MKKLKKPAAVLLSLAMTAMLSVPALAAGAYSITIQNDKTGHTYEAYQIFAGDVDSDAEQEGNVEGPTLSNITWGNGVNGAALLAALKAADAEKYGTCQTAADVAEALGVENATAADAAAFAEIAAEHLAAVAGTATEPVEGNYVIGTLDAGYYLVKDQDESLDGDEDSYTSYIVQVLGNVEMTPKSDIPSSEKKVKDINDTTDETYSDWQNTADHDIGDRIPFQLSATLPDNYTEYETYALTFHDTESAGLTFQRDTVKVYIDGELVSSGYTVVTSDIGDYTFEVRFNDLKTVTADDGATKAGNSSVITVEYESVLNENAVIGSNGNPNDMHITYSNNPNGEGSGRTPEDTVIVFTYKVDIDKVDQDMEPLAGAEFTLEKKNHAGEWEEVGILGTDGTLTEFSFTGLDDGTYRLSESKTPAGFNTIEPVEFTVEATHAEATLQLTTLSGNVTSGEVELTFTPSLSDGSLSTTVINNQGTTLPETGGIGTTIFFVLGGVLVVGAGVLLIVRLRMRAENKE